GKFRVGTLSLSGSTARGGYGIKSPFHNEALSRRAALDGPWRRPQSRPYLLIRALPASLPGTDHRTPATRPHHERGSTEPELGTKRKARRPPRDAGPSGVRLRVEP